jgi:hypothetical protein
MIPQNVRDYLWQHQTTLYTAVHQLNYDGELPHDGRLIDLDKTTDIYTYWHSLDDVQRAMEILANTTASQFIKAWYAVINDR